MEQSSNALKTYQTYINRCTKIWSEFLENALLVGQLQLIRNLIAFHLNKSCKFNAKNLESSLRSLNKSVISIHILVNIFVLSVVVFRALLLDISNDKYNPSEKLLLNLSSYFDYAGMNEPFNKVYCTSQNSPNHPITMFIFVIAHLPKIFLPQNLGKFFI